MGPHVEVRPVDALAALDVVAGTVVRLDEVRAATGMDAVVARPWNYVVLVPPAVNVADGVRAPAAEDVVVPSPGINLVLAREASNAVVVRRAENPVVRDRTGQRGRRDAGDSGQRGQRNERSDRRSSSRRKFVLLIPSAFSYRFSGYSLGFHLHHEYPSEPSAAKSARRHIF
jgi:hypothetical protein